MSSYFQLPPSCSKSAIHYVVLLSAVDPTTVGVNEFWSGLVYPNGLGKRSVGRPQARWSGDLRRTAGKSWMQVAENRAK
jgi:hypothetical protein